MTHHPARARSVLARLLAVALVTGVVGTVQMPPAAAAGTLTFVGHGYGHGRGMGQYGALGYAVDKGWGADRILAHYYGGSTLTRGQGNPEILVEITRNNGKDLVVAGTGLAVNGAATGSGAVRLSVSGGSLAVAVGPSCAGPWTRTTTVAAGAVVSTSAPSGDVANLLRLCEAGTDHQYRGTLQANLSSGVLYTVNRLPADQYLRGVVPRESPASWGTLGGGRGLEALKAQAVAARSYALASRSGTRASGAHTCDTESCQVYRGAAAVEDNGSRTLLEASTTDAAVAATSGWVMKHADGRIAMTEFSSSTGGYTAGGTFTAVVDEGDSYAGNPNRTWTVQLSTDVVAARLGTGPLRSMQVTARNGLGKLGGRATTVVVVDTAGRSTSFTGARVRSLLGLKSDWFTISGWTLAEAQSVVRALYVDLLGREVDPSGLATWTNELMAGRPPAVVVDTLTRSYEYRRLRISQAYQEVFGRAPDEGGLVAWTNEVASGAVTVDDVKRRLLDSGEFFSRSGGTPQGYVARLYQSVLGRTASEQEVESWSARFASLGRSGVATAIWGSRESAMWRSGLYYPVLLGRAADRGGLMTWSTVLLRDGEAAVRNGMAASGEYRNRAVSRFPA